MGDAQVSSGADRRVLVLEPYYGGSHKAFLDALQANSRHKYKLLTLPARKWKWRMRGAGIWFAQELTQRSPTATDLILTCDMLSVADLRGLLRGGWRSVPVVYYVHEDQLTYPLSDADWRDYQFGFTNMTSCLAADAVWFNSAHHRDAFFDAADRLLGRMPDHVPWETWRPMRGRVEVFWPPVEAPPGDLENTRREPGRPLTIVWNHRWEYDKNPEELFGALLRLEEAGHDFRVILMGQTFREAPRAFAEAWERLAPRIVQMGFVGDRREYWAKLASADVVVSTAIQENFGISVVEAMLAGCWPVLPKRLAYPEILPAGFHASCLYDGPDDLQRRLAELATRGVDATRLAELTRQIRELHDPVRRAAAIDEAIERLREGSPAQRGGQAAS